MITRRPSEADKEFARNAHHDAYREVVIHQFGSWDPEIQDQYFEKKWANENFQILQVEKDQVEKDLCGFVILEDQSEALHLVELVLRPEYQGQGLGTEFLNQLIRRSEEGQTPIRLSVLLKNRAFQLYERMGFVESDQSATHRLMERTNWS